MNGDATRKALTWIESTGGPLLLLELELLPFWQGILEGPAEMTDYDRACQITSYVGKIEVGPSFGIVLSGEPLSTTWYEASNLGNSFIARWVCAEDELAVVSALGSVPIDTTWEQTGVNFETSHRELIVFDSSCSSSAIDTYLAIELRPGRYSIETLNYEPNDQVSLILHRFRPLA
jgi:immunity protein 21 of polymorphic toxin system